MIPGGIWVYSNQEHALQIDVFVCVVEQSSCDSMCLGRTKLGQGVVLGEEGSDFRRRKQELRSRCDL